jgi:hypothetical protein
MAASKRKSAAKKAGKTRTPRRAAKKAVKTRKQRTAGKKAAATPKRRTAAKKAVVTRKTKAVVRPKTVANVAPPAVSPAVAEIDQRIAIVRNNLRELVEQAASYSGASAEELISQRISEQEAKLELLKKQREELS